MIVFDPLLLMAIILVSSGITGIPLSFAAFKKTDLGVVEKALIGFALGLLLPPLVSFLGVFTLNLKFGLSYGLAVHAIVAVAGIAFAYKERVWEEYKHFSPIPKLPKGQSFGDYFSFAAHFAPIALLFFVIATFLIRYQSFSPIYSEIDPYWYLYGAGQLLSQGTIPLKDNIVWYPLLETGHRAVPQLHHLWASWYSLYTGGGAFDTYMLSIIAGFYAPIFAAFTAFFAYLLFSREYGKSMGLLSAGLLSALPIFIQNTAGGQSQATAANFFGFLFFYASLALALKFKSTRFALLSCFALLSTILSTNVASAVTTTLFLFTIFQSVLLIFGKNKDDYMYFLKLSALLFATHLLSSVLLGAYTGALSLSSSVQYLASVVFSAGLFAIMHHVKESEMRLYIFIGFAVVGIGAVLFTPVGQTLVGVIKSQLSTILVYSEVYRTIAEQGPAPASYQNEFGFIGLDLSGVWELLSKPFDLVATTFLGLLNFFVGLLFGIKSGVPPKDSSLALSIMGGLIIATILGLARSVLHGLNYKHVAPSLLFILLFFAIFPTSLGGFYRLKYMVFFGVFSTLSIAFFFGEIREVIKAAIESAKMHEVVPYIHLVFALLAALVIIGEFFIPSQWAPAMLSSSLTGRYQDNPAAFAEKFGKICRETNDPTVCASVNDPRFNDKTNNQFDARLCYLSIVFDYKNPTQYEQIAAGLKCSKITNYWVDSMEWINKNIPKDDRVISWWDYGHWINYYGQKNSVLGNIQASTYMITKTAHAFTKGTPSDLKSTMKEFQSRHALFDMELLGSYSAFGGKYGALNYLACNYLNRTDSSKSPGQSECEAEYLWEEIYVPADEASRQGCTVSESQRLQGIVGSTASRAADQYSGQVTYTLKPQYCLSTGKLANGQQLPIASYYLDRKDENGNLVLNKATLKPAEQRGAYFVITSYYNKEKIWPGPNGTAVWGWDDRKGKFYDTNLYNAMFTEDLPGFKLVYKTDDASVKIYEMLD